MAGSRRIATKAKALHGTVPLISASMMNWLALPDLTPGPRGINDAIDPRKLSFLGDSPGPLGINDYAVPQKLMLSGLNTIHAWLAETNFRSSMLGVSTYNLPAGDKSEVIAEAYDFILQNEGNRLSPYWPRGNSGITIGVGYDLSKHSEKEIRVDWSELDNHTPTLPFTLSDLDRLSQAAGLTSEQSKAYLEQVRNITIPKAISLKVFKHSTLPNFYAKTKTLFPGMAELPARVQVALIDLVYNRGPKATGQTGNSPDSDILDNRWEVRQIRQAVASKDLLWIHWYLVSMSRIWPNNPGLRERRNREADLIEPYIAHDLAYLFLLKRFIYISSPRP